MAFEGKAQVAEKPAEFEARQTGRRCFVILPYAAPAPGEGPSIDFDAVFNEIIQPVAEDLDLDCIRSDRVSRSGLIHREMVENIIDSDVVIADISLGSPDIFFELGIRQAARRAGTVVMCHSGTGEDFNITGVRALDYELPPEGAPARAQILADCRALLRTHIKNSLDNRATDSIVHSLIPGINIRLPDRPLPERRYHIYKLGLAGMTGPKAARQIEIVTGDIADIDDIDVWVNPENTRMELARLHDSSVSATIRYLGSRRDRHGFVRDDAITRLLRGQVGANHRTGIEPATTMLTRAGALGKTNKVKLLVHVAAHQGEPGRGYQLIGAYRKCVTNALAAVDQYNARFGAKMNAKSALRSVLIPLFGARSPGESPHERVQGLIHAAHQYLLHSTDTKIERVAFLAWTQVDLELCQAALHRLGLKPAGVPRGPGSTPKS